MRIGFIGLGTMGKPMAHNLLMKGFSLTVTSRTRAKVEKLAAEGATPAASAAEVAAASDVVFSCVPDVPEVEEVLTGPQGVLAGARKGLIYADMSTIAPSAAQRFAQLAAERGVTFLDAPVTGGEIGAIEGKLTIMVGGDRAAFEAALPAFAPMGTAIYIGPSGSGQKMKLTNNIIVALTSLAVAEGLHFARAVGLDPAQVIETIKNGAAGSWSLERLGPKMIAGDYKPGFKLAHLRKDLRYALEAARAAGAHLSGTTLTLDLCALAQARGGPECSTAAIFETALEE